MSDRGEHTETATRAGEAEAVEAARIAMEQVLRGSIRADEAGSIIAAAYPIIAAAVRAEEREQIARRIEAHTPDDWRGDPHATRAMLERNQALRDAYRYAARLARGSS